MKYKNMLYAILIFSAVWQPTHHYLMSQGMSMNFGVHSLVSLIPYLIILVIIAKKNPEFFSK